MCCRSEQTLKLPGALRDTNHDQSSATWNQFDEIYEPACAAGYVRRWYALAHASLSLNFLWADARNQPSPTLAQTMLRSSDLVSIISTRCIIFPSASSYECTPRSVDWCSAWNPRSVCYIHDYAWIRPLDAACSKQIFVPLSVMPQSFRGILLPRHTVHRFRTKTPPKPFRPN